MRRTSKPSFVVHLLTGFLVLSLASCGGDDCLECSNTTPDQSRQSTGLGPLIWLAAGTTGHEWRIRRRTEPCSRGGS